MKYFMALSGMSTLKESSDKHPRAASFYQELLASYKIFVEKQGIEGSRMRFDRDYTRNFQKIFSLAEETVWEDLKNHALDSTLKMLNPLHWFD